VKIIGGISQDIFFMHRAYWLYIHHTVHRLSLSLLCILCIVGDCSFHVILIFMVHHKLQISMFMVLQVCMLMRSSSQAFIMDSSGKTYVSGVRGRRTTLVVYCVGGCIWSTWYNDVIGINEIPSLGKIVRTFRERNFPMIFPSVCHEINRSDLLYNLWLHQCCVGLLYEEVLQGVW